jgi:hypothetical protein
MSHVVKLDRTEMYGLEVLAAVRHAAHVSKHNGKRLTMGYTADGRDEEAIGVYGEYAAAQVLDVSWRPVVDDYTQMPGDIGELGVEVRTSKSKGATHLILNPRDNDSSTFIFVRRLSFDELSVEGWLLAAAGKQDRYWRADARSPSWWIPMEELHPMESFLYTRKEPK